MLSFGLSAAVHIVGDRFAYPDTKIIPFIHWYCLQALIILFEDMVRILYQYTYGGKETYCKVKGWKVLGYLWVLAVFGWSLPKMQIPQLI
jgi:hypothetical protein